MVIETKEQYSVLLDNIKDKEVLISFIRDDFRTHPCESNIIAASLSFEDQSHDIIFTHSETFETLDPKLLNVAKLFWTDDSKQFYHLFGLKNVNDVSVSSWCENKEVHSIDPDQIFWLTYKNNKSLRALNYVVPLSKIIEFTRDKLMQIDIMKENLEYTEYSKLYNTALMNLAEIEKNGLSIIPNSFGTVFKNGMGYSNYNVLTSTGRPSNTFSGVNLGALNKTDGTRKHIVSRFEKGMLIEFDYDAYHLRLLGDIMDYSFPLNESVHQYFADNVYKCSYEDSKTKSFQILYGNTPPSEGNGDKFFKGIADLSSVLWDHFNANNCLESHIYKKPFIMEDNLGVNRNKLLNYYIQSYETERNLDTIGRVNDLLSDRGTKMILYTYDSFLFDFDMKDGINVLKSIKDVLEDGKFPVKVKAGINYHNMKDISEKINGYK